jgi:hypothetical protein
MAELEKTNLAQVSIFMFLRVNGQSTRPFITETDIPGMGAQKMRDLTYYNSAASQDMLKALAAQIAHMLIVYINTYYTQQREPNYENKSISDLVGIFAAVLIDMNKTVYDLAQTTDKVFRFKNEGSAAVPVATVAANLSLPESLKKRLNAIGIK